MLFRRAPKNKVMVIGLDCADPELVFHRWCNDLPNIKRVMQAGCYGPLQSVTPPITVPAWMCMMTSRDPGELGVYGFRNRGDYTYDKLTIANSACIQEPKIWDVLGRSRRESIIIGVPPTYPVPSLRGSLVSCFLTPDGTSHFTHPQELGKEVQSVANGYMVDVKGFRTENKKWLLSQIYEMTSKRFTVAKHLLKTRPWDFFMMVEMGTDRIHHGFWQFMDSDHVLYPGPNEFQRSIHDYYRYLDSLVGELLDFVDDHTTVLIVSDHGAKRMDGAICLNEWLIQNGYLVLKRYPAAPTRFENLEVDWPRTQAWGEGGYYGRIFLNVARREPQGIIPLSDYDRIRRELKQKLEDLGDEHGRPIRTRAVLSDEAYRETRNVSPDLSIFFGDLYWRASGTVGSGQVHTRRNDTGPDGANHDWKGIFIMAEGRDLRSDKNGARLEGLHLLDVAPTVLQSYGISPLPSMHGMPIGKMSSMNLTPGFERAGHSKPVEVSQVSLQ